MLQNKSLQRVWPEQNYVTLTSRNKLFRKSTKNPISLPLPIHILPLPIINNGHPHTLEFMCSLTVAKMRFREKAPICYTPKHFFFMHSCSRGSIHVYLLSVWGRFLFKINHCFGDKRLSVRNCNSIYILTKVICIHVVNLTDI